MVMRSILLTALLSCTLMLTGCGTVGTIAGVVITAPIRILTAGVGYDESTTQTPSEEIDLDQAAPL